MGNDDGTPVIIVGGGPGGLAAARELTDSGIHCELFDDNLLAGGQYFRQLAPETSSVAGGAAFSEPRALDYLAVLRSPLLRYHRGTTVWEVPEPLTVAFAGPDGSGRLKGAAIVIAAGAHDRACPFPGWTLPGVISAGGCLNLLKGYGAVPGKRVAVVGNGPLVLVAAQALIKAGVDVPVVAEAGRIRRRALAAAPGLAWAPRLLLRGLGYFATTLGSTGRYREGFVALEAYGEGEVDGLAIAPLGADGTPTKAGSERYAVDAVVVGYGLTPSTEVSRRCGLAHRYHSERGGWLVERSADCETTSGSVFVVGDAAGIGGAEMAISEGRLVGAVIAQRLAGGCGPSTAVRRRLRRLQRFQRGVETLYRVPQGLRLANGETVLCRCENIRLADIAAATHEHAGDLTSIKMATRASMGRCQGRNCLSALAQYAAEASGTEVRQRKWPRMRPPVRLVPISHLLAEELAGVPIPECVDEALGEVGFEQPSEPRGC